jgi:hypothetical protein
MGLGTNDAGSTWRARRKKKMSTTIADGKSTPNMAQDAVVNNITIYGTVHGGGLGSGPTVIGNGGTVANAGTINFGSDATVSGSTPTADVAISSGSAPAGIPALIASAASVDVNTAGDTTMTLSAFAAGNYFVADYALATNPSVPLSAAAAAVWSGAGGTGQQYMNASFGGFATALQNRRDWYAPPGDNTPLNAGFGTMQNTAPIVNVSTPEGSPATVDFYVYGRVFS